MYQMGFIDGFRGTPRKDDWFDHDYLVGYNAGVLEREIDVQHHKSLIERLADNVKRSRPERLDTK